jgi:hypothetical protein
MRYLVMLFIAASTLTVAQTSKDFLAGDLRDDCKLLNDEHRTGHTQVEAFKTGQCGGYLQGWIDGIEGSADGYPFLPDNEPITIGQVSRVFILYLDKHPEKENQPAFNGVLDAMVDARLISIRRVFAGPKLNPH